MSGVSGVSEGPDEECIQNVFGRALVEECGQMTDLARLVAFTFTTYRW